MQDAFGGMNELCLIAKSTLISISSEAGRLGEAIELAVQLIEVRHGTLQAGHPDMLALMSNVSFMYEDL